MELLGVHPLKILPAVGEEIADPGLTGGALAETLALHKAREVAQRCSADDIVIGADTIVCLDDAVFGKPHDEADAARMLRALSDSTHRVISGVALLCGDDEMVDFDSTGVRFGKMSEQEIDWYVKSGEPNDKAGAYAVQGLASLWIKGLEGDYFNVVGLPVFALDQLWLRVYGEHLSQIGKETAL
jgi:septum formation protein